MIEDVVRSKLLELSAVTALTTVIRADELLQTDLKAASSCGIIISVDDERYENDMSCTTGTCFATLAIVAISQSKSVARAVSEAIRINGTDPGTGMHGMIVTSGSIKFQSALLSRVSTFFPFTDGSEDGYFAVNSSYSIIYTATR